ncbi:MAG: bifunctional proline dehydrogenase/L-glutamate gamma-semialdehyde dehydrogenase PutA [Pseudomonadales bacterium]
MAGEGLADLTAARAAVRAAHRADEAARVAQLAGTAALDAAALIRVRERATRLVQHVRAERRRVGGIDALMQEYDLTSAEGVTLMCLAEALLRIPDAATQDMFIEDQLGAGNWSEHLGASEHFFVNASTFGLMVAGSTVTVRDSGPQALERVVRKLGQPAIRLAVRRAMRILGRQFVFGETLAQALELAERRAAHGYLYSFDMLGEAAWTGQDAERYFERYCEAVRMLGAESARRAAPSPQVSVKLSALHPRYELAQQARVDSELYPRLLHLCTLAAGASVSLCIDAEESDRLELSLSLVERLARERALAGWDGLGLAVQAYQKRALPVIEWLVELAGRSARRFTPRLVKGAYWDAEIKLAQERGLSDFPVFTRKVNTDVSYLACAAALLRGGSRIEPCFATHNAYTVAAVLEMAGPTRKLEFQRLHGMGGALYDRVLSDEQLNAGRRLRCRVYAPVGGQEELLAYLVRRLLENGANTSFVNRIADDALPLDAVVQDPVAQAERNAWTGHPRILKPAELFAPVRRNSQGLDLHDREILDGIARDFASAAGALPRAAPIVAGSIRAGEPIGVQDPATLTAVGSWVAACADDARDALAWAAQAAPDWWAQPVRARADRLRSAARSLEVNASEFMWLLCSEGGRCLQDAHLEVREAVDFLRFYASEAERLLDGELTLPGPTGERNTLSLRGRGPFLCISPWNFPLAIFTGQVAAALVTGNSVLAKPAEQTPLVAQAMVRLLFDAGVPHEVLHLLPGDGPELAGALLPDPRLAGVAFTGSFATARSINGLLAARAGPIIPFIAETGGVNAMIVDATALPEQVTRDVLQSAFRSAGQRCSALRLLCLQDDIADRQLAMISGAMQELKLGDPRLPETDVGPVNDESAFAVLQNYRQQAARRFRLIAESPGADHLPGWFVRPAAFEVTRVADVPDEVFGPFLHVVRWRADALGDLVDEVNALRYGLTLSIHSRSHSRVQAVAARARVGNVYVNRNQIGAVVGSQPFGGEGLSGTGPKAGGPNYLQRFVVEQTLCEDTTAAGGNASLLTLQS